MVELLILFGLMIVCGLVVLVADFILPKIPFVQRWLDTLHVYED
jgi:hypothetical protein